MTTAVLEGRVAVVTGSAGQLGPVWVDALAGAGARVFAFVLPGTPADQLEFAQRDEVTVVEADVSDRQSLERACSRVLESGGAPHILVNNAGIDQPPVVGRGVAIRDIDPDGFLRVLQVNTLGAFQASQLLGSAMVDAGRGSIINIGSLYASVSPDQRFYDHLDMDPPFVKPPAYGASKAGLVNLTKFLATHWGPFGVRVNTLSPGGVAGGQDPRFVDKFSARVPLGRLAERAELVGPLLFLASDASSYVTGLELKVDGGFTAW